jgi:hypothetical protein
MTLTEKQFQDIERRAQEHDIERMSSFFPDDEPMPVFLLTPRWSPVILVDPTTEDLCFVAKEKAGWMLYVRAFIEDELAAFSVPVKRSVYELNDDGSMAVFGLSQLGPGTWRVVPSVNIPGQIHAFVILCGVPDPAPWDHCVGPRPSAGS